MTKEEKRAVASFKRLAKRWPKTLTLVQHFDSGRNLSVKRTADVDFDDPATAEKIDSIPIEIVCCT